MIGRALITFESAEAAAQAKAEVPACPPTPFSALPCRPPPPPPRALLAHEGRPCASVFGPVVSRVGGWMNG